MPARSALVSKLFLSLSLFLASSRRPCDLGVDLDHQPCPFPTPLNRAKLPDYSLAPRLICPLMVAHELDYEVLEPLIRLMQRPHVLATVRLHAEQLYEQRGGSADKHCRASGDPCSGDRGVHQIGPS